MTSFGIAPPYTPEEFAQLQERWAEYLAAVADDAWAMVGAHEDLRIAKAKVINEGVVARLMSTIELLQEEKKADRA